MEVVRIGADPARWTRTSSADRPARPVPVVMSGEDASTFTAIRKTAIVDGEPWRSAWSARPWPPTRARSRRRGRRQVPVVSSVAAGRYGEVTP